MIQLQPVREPLGYGRPEVLDFCARILRGVVARMDPVRRLPILPYDSQPPRPLYNRCPEEAFERTMVAAAIYARATGSATLDGADFAHHWREGLLQLVDPSSPHCVREPADCSPLGSEIALAAMICPEEFWLPFSDEQRGWIARFFDATTRNTSYDNNHWLFHMVPLKLVEACGLASNRAALEEKLQRCLAWHRGDGWFIDGCNRGYDWYTNHGFHLYFQLLHHFDAPWRERYGDRFRELARLYLRSYPLLFDRSGAMAPIGRSLGYRFVHVAPIAWMILNDAWTQPLGLARTLVCRHLRYFDEGGSLSSNGLLSPGYFDENPRVLEDYMDYGAQYFAVHAFSCLLLPADHPFWTAEPVEVARGSAVLAHGAVLRHTAARGSVFHNVHNGFRPDLFEETVKYFQHDYSTRGGLFVSRDRDGRHPHQHGCSPDGERWFYRHEPQCLSVSETQAVSTWRIGLPREFDDRVVLHHLFFEDGEVYVLYHTAATPLWLRFSGPAHHDDGSTSATLQQLAGPAGSFERIPAGVDLEHARPGSFTRWQSDRPAPPLTPFGFAVSRLKEPPSVTAQPIDGGLAFRWGGEERTVALPAMPGDVVIAPGPAAPKPHSESRHE